MRKDVQLLSSGEIRYSGKWKSIAVVLHSVLSKQEHENLTISWLISHHINMVRAIQVEPDCGGERLE